MGGEGGGEGGEVWTCSSKCNRCVYLTLVVSCGGIKPTDKLIQVWTKARLLRPLSCAHKHSQLLTHCGLHQPCCTTHTTSEVDGREVCVDTGMHP